MILKLCLCLFFRWILVLKFLNIENLDDKYKYNKYLNIFYKWTSLILSITNIVKFYIVL